MEQRVRGPPSGGPRTPKNAPKPSNNAPNTCITHNMAQMGMVVHAPKAKNDRIIDLFLVLDPKSYPGRYGPYPKIWDQDMAVGKPNSLLIPGLFPLLLTTNNSGPAWLGLVFSFSPNPRCSLRG